MASTLKTNALVTLADLQTYLQVGTGETAISDVLLEMFINNISAMFDREIRPDSQIIELSANLTMSGNGLERLYLPRWPITSLASITEDDVALTAGDEEDYVIESNGGFLIRVGIPWSNAYKQNIVITTFKAGYTATTLPVDIYLGALKQCAIEYQHYQKMNWGETSRSFPDGSVARNEVGLLKEVQDVLNRYKRVRI